MTIDESYKKEVEEEKAPEYQNTKDSTENSSEIEKSKHLFVSKTEDDDWQLAGFHNRGQTLNAKMKNHFDSISENESESCFTTQELEPEEIKDLFLSEPTWHPSSSWIKPMPHRQYKIKTIW